MADARSLHHWGPWPLPAAPPTEESCRQWAEAYHRGGTGGPDADWCRRMAAWMEERSEQDGMRGPMMQASPGDLQAACRRFSAGDEPTTGDAWCDDMVRWMQEHGRMGGAMTGGR